MRGKVRIWNRFRNFGFIEVEERVFLVRRADVLRRADLWRGAVVAFVPSRSPRGWRARSVRVVEPEGAAVPARKEDA